MKRSTIEAQLNAAMNRSRSADMEVNRLQSIINYHDDEASRQRQRRYKEQAKKDRADRSIVRLANLLEAS